MCIQVHPEVLDLPLRGLESIWNPTHRNPGIPEVPVPFRFTDPHPCDLSVESCTDFTL